MGKRISLFTLQTFSTTGGIQKMTRTLGHSLSKIANRKNWDFKMLSAYDASSDLMPQYLPAESFEGFGKKKAAFTVNALGAGLKSDVVILSHINLSLVGLIIKLLKPKCAVWLIAHGIEVWRPLSPIKKMLLKRCDKIVCVSNFTRQQMIAWHKIEPGRCVILNNTVDPFMNLPVHFNKPQHLLNKYSLTGNGPIIFTLTRLAATEQYKGHEQVINVIGKLKVKFPGIKYILSGQYDADENIRINELIAINGVEEQVILTGFISENELPDHFLLADLFVLPSKKEGFGIVFIEAMACGLPVICGNADGSIDAIRNGELGKAIDVDNLAELEQAITENLKTPLTSEKRENLQRQCLRYFNEQDYMAKLERLFTA
jgi:phosphatidylinositol alpha-1,6-mannosyltransferase